VALLVFVCGLGGLIAMGHLVDRESAHTVATPLDEAVPFLPWTAYVYALVYTAMLYPLFVVRCGRLFRRTVLAYAVTVGVSLLCFVLYPVTSLHLRPDISALDDSVFHNWGVHLCYTLDPPANLLPSLHMSVALVAAISSFMASRLFGSFAFIMVAAITPSILTMKQHYVLDAVAALPLVAAVYVAILRPYRHESSPPAERAFSWRGPAAFLGFNAFFYLAFYAAFRAGLRFW